MYTIKKQKYAANKTAEPEFEGMLHTVSMYYERYRQIILITVTAVLVLLVAYGGYSLYQSGNEGKASAMLSRAYSSYGASAPDYGKALEMFREIQKSYPSTLSGAIAQYYIGNCLMGMGNAREAVEAYQSFVKRYSSKKELLGLVYQRMGYASALIGDDKQALASFENSEKLLGPGISTIETARLYEKLGQTEEAQKKYQLAAEKLAGTALSEEAKKDIKTPAGTAATQSPAPKGAK